MIENMNSYYWDNTVNTGNKEKKILLWISSYLNFCTDSRLSVNFRIFSLFLHMSEICCLLILNLSAKFVLFSPFCKYEIILCLSFIKRMDCFHCIDMAVIWVQDWLVLCLHNRRGRITELLIISIFQHHTLLTERLRFMLMPNGTHEFVPHVQVFPLIVVTCLLLKLRNK